MILQEGILNLTCEFNCVVEFSVTGANMLYFSFEASLNTPEWCIPPTNIISLNNIQIFLLFLNFLLTVEVFI